MHRFDSVRRGGNFLHGETLPDAIPGTVIVRFTDDSPEDGIGGAAVFDVRARVEIELGGGNRQIVTNIVPVVIPYNGAFYSGSHWEANGDGIVEYHFNMPQNAVGVEFDALVGNDYSINISQIHNYKTAFGAKSVTKQTEGYVVRRAHGNVKDLSNKRRLSFRYGLPSAMNFYGLNFDLNVIGFKLRGEIAWNRNYFQYPVVENGVRNTMNDRAYYLLGEKEFGKFKLGGEVFSIGPKYSSYDPYTLGFYFNETGTGYGYRVIDPLTSQTLKTNTLRYAFVDDNDDYDRYPDQYWGDTPQLGEGRQALEAGVFPGLDKDQDGVPDNNRNNNHIPDYMEPFLKYDCDPNDFYWGDDMNNNGIVDAFENDDLPDYPYYKDEQGAHFFMIFTPIRNLDFTIGNYDVHQIAGGGLNKVKYGKIDYFKEFPGRGEIEFHHQIKRVRDDIKNFTYSYEVIPSPGRSAYRSVPIKDELLMRNSLVNRGLLRVNVFPLRNLNVSTSLRYELNNQFETEFDNGLKQPGGTVDYWGIASKIGYIYKYKKFVFIPRFKHLHLKRERSCWAGPYQEYTNWYPILRLDYKFTKRTLFQLGVQGFPFFQERYKDEIDPMSNFSSATYVFEVVNFSVSWGYKLVTTIGYQYTSFDYDSPQVNDTDFSKFFIRLIVGEEIVGSAQ